MAPVMVRLLPVAEPKYDPENVTSEAPPPPEGAEEVDSSGSSKVYRIRSDEEPGFAPGSEPGAPKRIVLGQAVESSEARSGEGE